MATSPADRPRELSLLIDIDHVAIAVEDLDAAIDYHRRALGMQVAHRELVEGGAVEEAMLSVGDSYVQLLSGARPDSTVSRFVARNGPGLHHVAYRVRDCAEALASMVAAGATPIDGEPRPGARGSTIAFVHPKGSLGTLIELVELP